MSLSAIAVDLLTSPVGLALFALLALLLWRRGGRVLAVLLLVPLVLLSLPLVAEPLLASLDPPAAEPGPPPGAIVILSADVERTRDGGTDLGALTLERERAGAALARRTGLPVLVTGGVITAPPPLGVMMGQSLPADFGVPVQWIEARSGTTWENATFSAPMLQAAGIRRVYLVTHAWHQRRALLAFERAGLEAVPVSVRADPWPRQTASVLIPRMTALGRSALALHEWVGLLYYMWRS